MKEGAKLYQQKLHNINPKLDPLFRKELEKMMETGIIRALSHTTWVWNPVIVRNKNGENMNYIDFINLNQDLLKDDYH